MAGSFGKNYDKFVDITATMDMAFKTFALGDQFPAVDLLRIVAEEIERLVMPFLYKDVMRARYSPRSDDFCLYEFKGNPLVF